MPPGQHDGAGPENRENIHNRDERRDQNRVRDAQQQQAGRQLRECQEHEQAVCPQQFAAGATAQLLTSRSSPRNRSGTCRTRKALTPW